MKINNYIIFRDDGVGDLLLITPVLKLIKKNDKSAFILLICSNRNNEYAEILIKNHLIDKIFNVDKSNSYGKLYGAISLYLKVLKFKPSVSLIFRQKIKNYIISRLCCSQNFGLVTINSSLYGMIKKYRPFKFLINFLLTDHVIIDQRENFAYINIDHWSDFYLNLYKKVYKKLNRQSLVINSSDKKYLVTNNSDIDNQISNALSSLNYKNEFIIIHIDEKWLKTNWSPIELSNFILNIKKTSNKKIILTQGIKDNIFNEYISKSYKFKKINIDNLNVCLSSLNEMNNVLIFKELDIQKLLSISSKSALIITNHGSLTHFASLYDIPVIDLVPNDKMSYIKKYYPKSSRYKQIKLDNSDLAINYVKDLIVND